MNTEGNNGNKPLGLWNVVSIGIGAMVGAGIFALLGQAALLMEASTWVAFALAVLWRCFPVMPMRVWGELSQQWRHYRLLSSRIRQRRLSLALSLLYLLTLAVSIAMVARALALMPCSFCMKAARRSTLFCSTRWGSLR